jgi:sec-independent protein translocase protein TatB
MFDLSLAELGVIGVVALVVIGPEKLPKVARTAGLLLGRAQRMVASVKADLDREMRNAELAELQAEVEKEADAIRADVEQTPPATNANPSERELVLAPGHEDRPDPGPAPADERQPDLFADPPVQAMPARDRR